MLYICILILCVLCNNTWIRDNESFTFRRLYELDWIYCAMSMGDYRYAGWGMWE